MQKYVHRSGVGVIGWRQGGAAPAPTTILPKDNHRRIVTRGRNGRYSSTAYTSSIGNANGTPTSITVSSSSALASGSGGANAYGSLTSLAIAVGSAIATGGASVSVAPSGVTAYPPTATASGSAGSIVWPSPASVLAGIYYGPTGTDYVGTLDFPTALEIADAVAAHVKTLTVGKFLALKD